MQRSPRVLLVTLRRLGPVDVDRLVAIGLLVAIELQVWSGPADSARLPAAIGGAVVALAVSVRRRWPLEALLVAIGATIAQDALSGATPVSAFGTIPAAILGFYGAGAFLAGRRARLALVLGVMGLGLDVLLTSRSAADLFFDAVIVGLLPWTTGQMARARASRERLHRAQVERIDAERELRALTAAYDERARIARELHDVIAHSVSVMVIQAGGARVVMDSDPSRAEEALHRVERAGRDALAEMRRLLGLLGEGTDHSALAPLPRLADVGRLVEHARTAGLEADLGVEGDAVSMPAALDLCAYRIVQEAITNSIKHAGPAHLSVQISWQREALEIEISDDGRGPGDTGETGRGHGIAGMRERVALHGGSLFAGACESGGYAVRARLPLEIEIAR
ncbi:MAG TPA: sensor histidine kinase [Gaiellales bacterium]|jgi:signal transduction histidine kinase